MSTTEIVKNVFKPNTSVPEESESRARPEIVGRMLQVVFPIELISQKRTPGPKRDPSWTNPISTKLWFLEKTREIFQSPIPSPSPSNLGSQFKLPSCPALLFQWLLFLDCASILALFLQSVIKSERGRAPYGLMALAGQGWWWICAARRAPYMQETFCLRPVLRPWWPRQGRTGWDLWKAVLSAHSAPMSPLVTRTVWVSDWTSGWIGSG